MPELKFRSFQRVRECTVSPPLKQQLFGPCLLALSAVSPQHIPAVPYQTLDLCLRETFILSYQLFPPSPFCVLWTLSCEHIECTAPFLCNQWTMTLKSNKNEPALILDSVNSMRTALSDLYLEQLLQNKPKSDKVTFIIINFCLSGFSGVCLFPRSRKGAHDHCLVLPPPKKKIGLCFSTLTCVLRSLQRRTRHVDEALRSTVSSALLYQL